MQVNFLKQITILIVAAIFLVIFLPGFAKMQELRQKNRDLESNIQKLKHDNLAFRAEKEKMENDPAYLEFIAREKLGIVKKGEKVYKLIPAAQEK